MQQTTVHFQDIQNHLEAFEAAQTDWLNAQEFEGWHLWSVVKKPLFYALKHQNYRLKSSDPKVSHNSKIRYSIVEGIKYLLHIFYFGLMRRNRCIIVTHEGNKQEREGDAYIDKFIDPIILSGAISNYLYFEHRFPNSSGRKGKVKPHINNLAANLFINVWRKRSRNKPSIIRTAKVLADKLNGFLAKDEAGLTIGSKKLQDILSRFWAEYQWYRLLWRWLKPSAVIIVDGIPRGLVAAARSFHIPVYELQHGFISDKKADYMVSGHFKPFKPKMVIPDYICVFGELFKQMLLSSGFWNSEEILVAGNYLIDKARTEMPYQFPDAETALHVLWAAQPTTFAYAQQILQQLAEYAPGNMHLHLKMHPLEPAAQVSWYREFAQKQSWWCSFINANNGFLASLKGKHLLVSFHSTALLEAVALGYPVISIATDRFANGINDLVQQDISDAVKTSRSVEELISLCKELHLSPPFAKHWHQSSVAQGNFFYAAHYTENIKQFFADFKSEYSHRLPFR